MTLQLASIHLYPLKSAAGLSPEEWEVDAFGLRYDRRWMVVDAGGRFVSQRTHPRLALVRPALGPETLRLEADGVPALELPLTPVRAALTTVVVWNSACAAVWLGRPAARWISEVLDADCDLVYMPESTIREANPVYAPPGSRVSFVDAYPFLMISQESLDDLNHRLPSPLPMNRFRPNLVIAGGEAFVEDRIPAFSVGELSFRVVKPCDRCVITTVDQATGQASGPEPVRTLATYRRWEGRVLFGQNVVHRGRGTLRRGCPLDP